MSRNTSRIQVGTTNDEINRALGRCVRPDRLASGLRVCGYNQNEDQFLLLDEPLDVPAMPVHHAMENATPPDGYVALVAGLVGYLSDRVPGLVAGTQWYFDPLSILTPAFWRLETYEGRHYLYHLLIDLTCRPLDCEILTPGTNSRTPAYRTRRLYFDCDYLPVTEGDASAGFFTLSQKIPFTWKGEAGQGYMIHGIWMDSDINKFFSKLILPAGKRNHPYYPVTCRHHCVSLNAFGLPGPEILHRVSAIIEPELTGILQDLQMAAFSELMPRFNALKAIVPADLGSLWDNLTVTPFLNERDQKEYTVAF